jgi:ABC-type multidrug transport system ATPase subunit
LPPSEAEAVAPNSAHVAIKVSDLVKFFGRFAALRGASYDFFAGNLYVILGDNGAGKSTLLRIVAGLMQPSQGSVTVLGSDSLRKVAQRVGYMGHAPLLYDELSGMENLRYFAGLYGIADDAVCRSAMQMVGLDPELQRRIGQYSQGMRQRLSLARAVLHNPDVILLDEPFSNVDVRSASDMAAILGRLRDSSKTILVITHQPAVMQDAADAFVHMSAGQIVSTTPASEWRTNHPTPAKEAGAGHPVTLENKAGTGHPDGMGHAPAAESATARRR